MRTVFFKKNWHPLSLQHKKRDSIFKILKGEQELSRDTIKKNYFQNCLLKSMCIPFLGPLYCQESPSSNLDKINVG
jgi:hypothetical protein